MFTSIRVKLDERVVVFKNGLPLRALAPGKHLLWNTNVTEQRWSTDQLVFQALPEVRAVLPCNWFAEVAIASRERGILWKDGVPRVYLRPGTHRYWRTDASVRLEVLSLDAPMPELTGELVAVLPRDEYSDVVVREHERGLEYLQGRLTRTLQPGRYASWSNPQARVEVHAVDIRRVQVAIVGQELMTRDKVTLCLSPTVEYAVEDAALATHAVTSVRDAVYLIA